MTQTCIVLAGGLGTRLRSVWSDGPKCLAPVGKVTFLELQLKQLASAGIERFVLSIGHLARQVEDFIAATPLPYRIDTVVEQQALGTGGAVLNAMKVAGLHDAIVTNGDTYLTGDIASMLRPFEKGGCTVVHLAVVEVPDRSRYGAVAVKGDRIVEIPRKGQIGAGLINAGLYRVDAKAFRSFEAGAAFSFENDVLPGLVTGGAVGCSVLGGGFIDIGVPADYREFCARYA